MRAWVLARSLPAALAAAKLSCPPGSSKPSRSDDVHGGAASGAPSDLIETPDGAQRIAALRQSFATQEGWRLAVDKAGIRCFYQRVHDDSRGLVRLRAEGSIDAPLFDVLCLLYEVDYWHRWVPSFCGLGLQQVHVLGQQGLLQIVYAVEAKLPWPFASRTWRFAAEVVDNMTVAEDPYIAILLDSKRALRVCPSLPAAGPNPKNIDCDIIDSGVILIPAAEAGGKTRVQYVSTIDAKFWVPEWLLGFVAMQMAYLLFKRLDQAPKWARSRELLDRSCDPEHPFYAHVRRRMAESLPAQLALAPPVSETAAWGRAPSQERA